MVKLHITLCDGTTDQLSFYDDEFGEFVFDKVNECLDVEKVVLTDGMTGEVLLDLTETED